MTGRSVRCRRFDRCGGGGSARRAAESTEGKKCRGVLFYFRFFFPFLQFQQERGSLGSGGLWHGLGASAHRDQSLFFWWFSRKRDKKREILEEVPRVSVRGFSLFRSFDFCMVWIVYMNGKKAIILLSQRSAFITCSDEWMVAAFGFS